MENIILIKKPKVCKVTFPCPGLRREDIQITFDPKTGALDIDGEPSESVSKDIQDECNLKINHSMTIDPKYRSKSIDMYARDGLASVIFNIAEGIVTIPEK